MKITFIGVGEAFDYTLANTCISCESQGKTLLIDCGYASAQKVWQVHPDANQIDFIYFTHWHADHFFGLPSLLTKWWEEQRKKELKICGQIGTSEFAKNLIEEGYPGIFWDYEGKYSDRIGQKLEGFEGTLKRPHFKIGFEDSDASFDIGPFRLTLAETNHSRRNLAVRVDVTENGISKSFAYSGDGSMTEKSKELYSGLDLLAHETYLIDEKILGHGCITDVISDSTKAGVKNLAVLHINRDVRKNRKEEVIEALVKSPIRTFMPEPGEIVEI